MSDLKSFVLDEIDYMIDILKKEVKQCNTRSNDTNEYRYGQIGSLNKSIILLKEFKKMVKKYDGVNEEDVVEQPEKSPISIV